MADIFVNTNTKKNVRCFFVTKNCPSGWAGLNQTGGHGLICLIWETPVARPQYDYGFHAVLYSLPTFSEDNFCVFTKVFAEARDQLKVCVVMMLRDGMPCQEKL